MENEWHLACKLLDSVKSFKAEALPVCRILTVNVTDTCCEHCYAEVCNHFAFLRICAFAHADYAVFLAADCTNLSLK